MEKAKLVSRRRFLASSMALASSVELRSTAFAMGVGADSTVCRLTAEQEIGPYYIAGELLRSDITEDKPGVPLALRIALLDARTCAPIKNAAVDIWHCDAAGVYSGYTKQSMMAGPGGPPPNGVPPPGFSRPPGMGQDGRQGGPGMGPPPQSLPSDKLTFLRGIQLSDADGRVNFLTVFPGYYMGRTNHIHFKVRLGGSVQERSYAAGHTSHIGQVFFPEEVAAGLMKHEPYSRHAIHRTTQDEDGVFGGQGGELSIARLRPSGNGYRAELIAAVDPTASPAPAQRQGFPG
jgi:protocatechuate 3,4-dioxygenase beta subunit